MKRFFNPRYLLPMILFFGVLTLGLRIGDIWQAAASGKIPSLRAALAQTKAETPPPAAAPAAEAAKPGDAGAKPPDAAPSPPPPEAAAEDESPAEAEVLKQLSDRRDQLDKRMHDLDTREKLIQVGEQRVDQKIKEMQTLRLQLQTMVDQINGAQQVQLANLVKIYETMKPQEAAKIFEALDMPVLLGVIERMKPKSTAPIMAAMAPEKAKEVTIALTKQDQLPKEK